MLTTPNGVKSHMTAATSENDWNRRIDEVKRANGGDYPSFWYMTIVATGLHSQTAAKWGGDGEIKMGHLK